MIRSTIELGNCTFARDPLAELGVPQPAKAVKLRRPTWPLPWMLSQDMIVNGVIAALPPPASASVISPKVVCGASPGCRSAATSGLSASNSPVTSLKL